MSVNTPPHELLGELPTNTVVTGVSRRLLEYLTSGALEVGDRLPGERELAASLKVGRSAIRGALAALDLLGIIETRPGSGSYLSGTSSELLPQSLTWGMMIGRARTEELVAIRSELEVMAARLAAEHATDEDVDYLRRCVDSLRDSTGEVARFIESDFRFHEHVAKMAGNEVLRDLLSTLRSLLRIWVDRSVARGREMDLTIADHSAVFRGVAARDPEAATSAMRQHMSTATARLLSHGHELRASGV